MMRLLLTLKNLMTFILGLSLMVGGCIGLGYLLSKVPVMFFITAWGILAIILIVHLLYKMVKTAWEDAGVEMRERNR